jgi:hypothetical protein
MQLHDCFESIAAACEAIKQHVLNNRESFKCNKSNKKQYSIICKEDSCGFRIQAFKSSKQVVLITTFKLHTCNPTVYYNNLHA